MWILPRARLRSSSCQRFMFNPSVSLDPSDFLRAMIPTRLVLARSTTVSGVSEWAASTWASLKPSQLHALQASSRLLSLGIKDHAKHREAPGKKLLSEKKLVSLSLGKTHLSSLSLPCVCVYACTHMRTHPCGGQSKG